MKKLMVFTLVLVLLLTFAACGGNYVCEECGESFGGKPYYGMAGDEIMCEDCARSYWMPLDYREFQYDKAPKAAAAQPANNSIVGTPDGDEDAPAPAAEASTPTPEPTLSPDEERAAKIREQVADIEQQLDAFDASGDIAAALDYANVQLELLNVTFGTGDDGLEQRLAGYREAYKQQALQDAQTTFAASGYEATLQLLNKSLGLLGGEDAEILEAIEYYKGFGPMWLADLDYFQKEGYREVFVPFEEKEDNLGEKHTHVMRLIRYGSDSPCSATYYINGKYKCFSGTFFVEKEDRDKDSVATVSVYGDDVLLYTFPQLAKDSLPSTFSIDITGVTMLRIEASLTKANWLSTCFGEAKLEP